MKNYYNFYNFLSLTLILAPPSGTSGIGVSKLNIQSLTLCEGLSMLTCFIRRAMSSLVISPPQAPLLLKLKKKIEKKF